jgi:hypothetical protein
VGKLGQTGTHGFRAGACVKEREREKMLLSRSDLALFERLLDPLIPSAAKRSRGISSYFFPADD